MSLDDKVGRHRARFRKVYPYGNTRRPDVRSFVDAITNTTKSFDFQKIQHDYPYYSVPTYLSTSWAMSGGISYATFLEATETFTNQTSYTVTFSTPFGGTPYLAFAPSQSQFSGSDGQETPNVAWWVTGLTSGGFTANFSAPFTGKITYRGVYTTGSYPIYVNRSTDLSGSYAWVSAGSSSLTNQSSLSMSFAALPSLPEFLNYNPVGSTSDELNIGQTIWAVSNSYAVNELSAPFTGIIHFLAMDTTGSDTSPFTANPDINYPPTGSFVPTDVSGLAAWWQADDVTLSGGKITQFNDKSGNGHHATNANVTYQLTQSVDAGYNNRTIAVANGNGNQVYAPTSFTVAQTLTIFAIGNGRIADWETFIDSTNVNRVIFRKDPTHNIYVYAGLANVKVGSSDARNPVVAWCEYNGASSNGNVSSNTATVLSTTPGPNSLTQPQLFGGYGGGVYPLADGSKFAALLIYNRALTTQERTNVLSYFSTYYGIAVSGL